MCYSILTIFGRTKSEYFKNVEEMTLRNPTTQKNKAALYDNAHKFDKTAYVVYEYTGIKSLWRVHFDRTRNFSFIN